MPRGVLVIGIGHPDRGDDAAGLLVARRLADGGSLPLEVRESSGDLVSLADLWAGADAVVLVDAVAGPRECGSVHVIDLLEEPPPRETGAGSTHGFGLAEAIALSRALGTLPRALRLVGIAGGAWDLGTAPSAAVLAAIPAAAAAARAESLRLLASLA